MLAEMGRGLWGHAVELRKRQIECWMRAYLHEHLDLATGRVDQDKLAYKAAEALRGLDAEGHPEIMFLDCAEAVVYRFYKQVTL